MKFQKHIAYVFILMFVGTLYFIFSSYQNTKRAQTAFQWVVHTHEVINGISQVQTSISGFESDLRGYVISGNPVFINSSISLQKRTYQQIQKLKNLTSDNPEQLQLIARLLPLIEKKIAFQKEVVKAYETSQEHALALIASLKGKVLTDGIIGLLATMEAVESRLLKLRVDENSKLANNKLHSSLVLGILAFGLLCAILYNLNKENQLRRQAEATALSNELKYKGLIENSAVVVYTANLEGVFTYISSKCKFLTGFSADELLGKHFTSIIQPGWRTEIERIYANQIKNNINETILEFPVKTKSGEEKWVEQSVVILKEKNEVTGFQSVVKDITERRKAQMQLKDAEQKLKAEQEIYQSRLQAILDNIPLGIFIKDLQGEYIMANRYFTDLLDKPDNDVLGKTAFDVVKDQELAVKHREVDEQVQKTLRPVEIEDLVQTDKERNLLTIKFPLLDNNNHLFAIGGACKDITETVQSRQKLVNAKLRAEQAERLQEEFLANMSHEIRTPMNGIVGMANLLQETPLSLQQKEYVKLIRQSSDNLLVLINDVLDLSKIKAGKMVVEKIDFNVKDVVDQVVSPMQIKAKAKGLQLNACIDDKTPPYVKGDPHKLNQILNNLVSNAEKFTSSGKIDINVKLLSEEKGVVNLEFVVADTGIGIAQENLGYIFESFTQAGSDTVRKFGGTGLGLAITKKLIGLQGGEIEVSSKLGEGTTFCFRIPYSASDKVLQPVMENTLGSAGIENEALKGKKLLLVEDNAINQKVILHILQKAEMQIDVAKDGQEAVNRLEAGADYNLIIMDLQMPVMNGFQATAYIRNKLKLNTPIFAMTASALRNEKMKCFELGMNEYLTKPFVPSDLFKQLNRYMSTEFTQQPTGKANDLYDLQYLYDIGDNDYIVEILEVFLATTPDILNELNENIIYEKWDEAAKSAHKLKSGLGALQMNRMLVDIATIETLGKQKTDLEKMPALIKSAMEQYELILPMLTAELNEVKNAN